MQIENAKKQKCQNRKCEIPKSQHPLTFFNILGRRPNILGRPQTPNPTPHNIFNILDRQPNILGRPKPPTQHPPTFFNILGRRRGAGGVGMGC